MPIYHLSVKTISRSAGRSATASAAYRSAERIKDERSGKVFDYSKRSGVLHSELVLPKDAPAWNSSELWNAAEKSELRVNSTVAREFVIALPSDLSADQRLSLSQEFTRELVGKHGFAAQLCIHEPDKKGDERNYHAHILCSTRRLEPSGFTAKTRELDEKKSGEVEFWRERFAALQNEHLEKAGVFSRVDHRSLAEQGIDRTPQKHKGVVVTAIERRTSKPSLIGVKFEMLDRGSIARERIKNQLEEKRKAERERQEKQQQVQIDKKMDRGRGLSR